MDSRVTGQRYLDGWVLTYNNFRGHEGLGNKTPASAATLQIEIESATAESRPPPVEGTSRGRERAQGETAQVAHQETQAGLPEGQQQAGPETDITAAVGAAQAPTTQQELDWNSLLTEELWHRSGKPA